MILCCLKGTLLFFHLSRRFFLGRIHFWWSHLGPSLHKGHWRVPQTWLIFYLKHTREMRPSGIPSRAPFPPLLSLLHPENPVDVKAFRLSKRHQHCPGRGWFLYLKYLTKTPFSVEVDQEKHQDGQTVRAEALPDVLGCTAGANSTISSFPPFAHL